MGNSKKQKLTEDEMRFTLAYFNSVREEETDEQKENNIWFKYDITIQFNEPEELKAINNLFDDISQYFNEKIPLFDVENLIKKYDGIQFPATISFNGTSLKDNESITLNVTDRLLNPEDAPEENTATVHMHKYDKNEYDIFEGIVNTVNFAPNLKLTDTNARKDTDISTDTEYASSASLFWLEDILQGFTNGATSLEDINSRLRLFKNELDNENFNYTPVPAQDLNGEPIWKIEVRPVNSNKPLDNDLDSIKQYYKGNYISREYYSNPEGTLRKNNSSENSGNNAIESLNYSSPVINPFDEIKRQRKEIYIENLAENIIINDSTSEKDPDFKKRVTDILTEALVEAENANG